MDEFVPPVDEGNIPFIETGDELRDVLQRWKVQSFVPAYVNLDKAMATLDTPEQIVEAHMQYQTRWTVCVHTISPGLSKCCTDESCRCAMRGH